jgi:putative hydrolase of the HAD superfamily
VSETLKQKQYKAIILDLGNVLVKLDYSRSFTNYIKSDNKNREYFMKSLFFDPIHKDHESGKISSDEFITEFIQIIERVIGVKVNKDEMLKAFNSIFAEPLISEDTLLKMKKNYSLYLFSNTSFIHFDYIYNNYSFMKLFDEFFLSYELKCMKPDEEIYKKVIEKIKISPSEIIFVDDMEANIEAAIKTGMNGIVFKGEEDLLRKLAELNVIQ